VRWARSHHVPLYCGEFGVYTRAAPPDSRQRWLTDVRELCEMRGIGWAMWDYCGGFRVAVGDAPGHRSLDPGCLQALGLPSLQK
jgi:endoglucanase